MMIAKMKKAIIPEGGGYVLDVTKEGIELYLKDVKNAIKAKKYRLERNSRRADNNELFYNYVINSDKVEEIILSLTVMDFSRVLNNEHKGFEYELLYVFGKKVELLERFGNRKKSVEIYIKFNKLSNNYLIIISFHEQRYPIIYYFK